MDYLKLSDSLLAEKSALLSLRGVGLNEQVRQLKEIDHEFTRAKLVSLKNHSRYKELLLQAAEELISSGQLELKTGIVELVPSIIKCLKEKLADNDVRAAVAAINVLIEKRVDDNPRQAQQIQVILPGSNSKGETDVSIPISKTETEV